MSTDSVLDSVRRLGPEVARRSDEIERNRTLPMDVVDLVRPTGAFRMYVPTDLGGPGVTAWESLEVLEELAYHDGATGWCAMIGSTTSLLASFLPDEHAREVFDDPDGIAGGFAMPVGRAVPVEGGGLRVTGRWAWGSGTRHSTWIGGGCLVADESGDPTPRPDGLAAPFTFFPATEVTFLDTWHVAGLEGTGSGDYEVTDCLVPEGRWVEIGSAPVRDNPLSRFSFFGLLAAGVASCAVGIGRRAVDELVALASTKAAQGSSRPLREGSRVQADVATAEAALAASWAFLREAVEGPWATAQAGESPTVEQRRRLRLSATHATQTAADVAESMYKAGGGAAVYRASPLQRAFRDAFVATQHAMVAPRTLSQYGRSRLGLDVDDTQF